MKTLLSSLAGLCLIASTAMAETVLIHGEAGPNRGARAAALQWFADEVNKRSEGDIKINIEWGGSLFKANAAMQSIGNGVSDLGSVIAVYYPKELAGYGIADLPLDNPDAWVGMRATDELMRTNAAIQASFAEQNLVYIGTFTTSAVHIGCKDAAIRSVEDIKGLKVRGVGAYGKTFKDFGANLVPMSIYKAYQGLDSGLLDCSQGYSYAVTALKQQEVISSYTLLNWGQVGGVGIFMNKDMFGSLSKAQQDLILATGKDMADEFGRLITTANAKAVEAMKAAGIEVIELSGDERSKLVDKGAGYIGDWVNQANQLGIDGKTVLDEYRALIEKYSKQRDEKGYPWAAG
ncbi:MAG: C4-dicarboxylate TRAP transporter substrate-binding protein [Pseudomonadota bacterium]